MNNQDEIGRIGKIHADMLRRRGRYVQRLNIRFKHEHLSSTVTALLSRQVFQLSCQIALHERELKRLRGTPA